MHEHERWRVKAFDNSAFVPFFFIKNMNEVFFFLKDEERASEKREREREKRNARDKWRSNDFIC